MSDLPKVSLVESYTRDHLDECVENFRRSSRRDDRREALTEYLFVLACLLRKEKFFNDGQLGPLSYTIEMMEDLARGAIPSVSIPAEKGRGERPSPVTDRDFWIDAAVLVDFIRHEKGIPVDAAIQETLKRLGQFGLVHRGDWQKPAKRKELKEFRKRLSKGVARSGNEGEQLMKIYKSEIQAARPSHPQHEYEKERLRRRLSLAVRPLEKGC